MANVHPTAPTTAAPSTAIVRMTGQRLSSRSTRSHGVATNAITAITAIQSGESPRVWARSKPAAPTRSSHGHRRSSGSGPSTRRSDEIRANPVAISRPFGLTAEARNSTIGVTAAASPNAVARLGRSRYRAANPAARKNVATSAPATRMPITASEVSLVSRLGQPTSR